MDLLAIRTRVRSGVGSPSTTDVTDTVLNGFINDATSDLAVKFPHHKARRRTSFNTVADTQEYDLPSDVGAILRVWDETNHRRLEKIADSGFSELPDMESGKPLKYCRFRTQIALVPSPDEDDIVIWIHYRQNLTAMSADGDEPELPRSWHHGIVLLAKWYYYDDQGDVLKKNEAWATYRTWLDDMPTEQEEESADIDSGVRLPTLATRGRKQADDFEDE